MESTAFFAINLGGPEGGPVEVDETFVGPNRRKMHASKLQARKQGTKYKMGVPVMGMLDRELRQVRAKVVPNVKREVLQNEILNNIEHKSTVYTDGWASYDTLKAQEFVPCHREPRERIRSRQCAHSGD